MRPFVLCVLALAFLAGILSPASAETTELRISKQPGLQYLPLLVMEHDKLIEKHARALGLGDLTVSWVTLNSGGIALDALLAGRLDMVTTGISNLVVAWSGTNGQIKGVSAVAALPMWLVTKNPNVKTVKDFTAADRIAVPTIRVSVQATLLAMAADQNYGGNDLTHFDPMTIALGHPDAYIALQSGSGTVDSHFSSPPYQYLEVKLPGVHQVLNSFDLFHAPLLSTCVFSTVKFHDANPKTVAAFVAAMKEAIQIIARDHQAAAQTYLEVSGEKWAPEELVRELNDKNFIYTVAPIGAMHFADVMSRAGTIKTKPASWKDFFFPEVTNLNGS